MKSEVELIWIVCVIHEIVIQQTFKSIVLEILIHDFASIWSFNAWSYVSLMTRTGKKEKLPITHLIWKRAVTFCYRLDIFEIFLNANFLIRKFLDQIFFGAFNPVRWQIKLSIS